VIHQLQIGKCGSISLGMTGAVEQSAEVEQIILNEIVDDAWKAANQAAADATLENAQRNGSAVISTQAFSTVCTNRRPSCLSSAL
jgi:hypothetical protein